MKTPSTVARDLALLVAAGSLLAVACDEPNSVVTSPSVVVQGDGNVVEQSRAVGGFRRLDHRGVGHVYIRQGAYEELRVRAEQSLLPYLRTDVQAGELVIWKEGVTLLNTRPIEYHLTVTDLERVALTGAGQIEGTSLDGGPLQLLLSGVGNIELADLNASAIAIESSGVGNVILSGSAYEQTVGLRGVGGYDGSNLDSVRADVLIVYGGSATVRVRDHLRATIQGSGSVYYIGDPFVDSNVSGSGKVERIGG